VLSSATEPLAWGALALIVLGAVLAQNALNTFDNADGAATSLAALGLCLPAPLFAAPLLAFLPFNLRRRGSPSAYLGDAGSHLVGMLVLLTPAAWPVLALPLLDLSRLSVVRLRRGQMPWVGDRRHLAHRLAALGLGPLAVVRVLLGLALPAVLTGWVSRTGAPGPAVALGVLATGLLFRRAVRATPEPVEPAPSPLVEGVAARAGGGSAP
jgi:UDP-GlcNAc:undecaprenyl-phosphate GlcNAc-1-phosphate transferase